MVIRLTFLFLILLVIFCSISSVLLIFQEEIGLQQAPMKTALKLNQSFKSLVYITESIPPLMVGFYYTTIKLKHNMNFSDSLINTIKMIYHINIFRGRNQLLITNIHYLLNCFNLNWLFLLLLWILLHQAVRLSQMPLWNQHPKY